jgi:SAM-dependent methyltransferase
MATTGARSGWTDGYVSDVAYTDGYYAELAPVHLNYVAMLNHCAPRRLDRPFTYCELGCGNGHTVSVLAAAYPDSQFFACDINPAHVAKARQWAEAAGLKNLTILEASFQEMVAMDLPQFDFITFHGIYSWISEINRKAMLDVMARHLQPGGLVYNSYNCLPGWAGQAPIQRLMLEIGRDIPGDSLVKAHDALDFLEKLSAVDCRYLRANPSAASLLQKLATRPRSYVAHEYLNEEWHPLYCVDVFREMSMAKLTFVGAAMVPENHPHLFLGKDALAVLEAQPTRERQQLVKDFLLNQRFRCDVYVKGLSTLTPADSRVALRDLAVGLIKSPESVSYTAKYQVGTLNFDHARSRAIVAALSQGAMTVGELAEQPRLSNLSEARLQESVHTLISAGQIVPFASPAPRVAQPTGKITVPSALNRHVLSTAMERAARGLLASTIAGRGVSLDRNERCFTHEIANGRTNNVPETVWAELEKRGLRVKRGEQVMNGREASVAELQRQFVAYKTETLPVLRQLGIVVMA